MLVTNAVSHVRDYSSIQHHPRTHHIGFTTVDVHPDGAIEVTLRNNTGALLTKLIRTVRDDGAAIVISRVNEDGSVVVC